MRPPRDVTARRLCVPVSAKPTQSRSGSGGVQFYVKLSFHSNHLISSLAVVGGDNYHTMAPTQDLFSVFFALIVGLKLQVIQSRGFIGLMVRVLQVFRK